MSGMKKLIEQYGDLTGIVKKVKTDMTDDELSRGILSFRKRPKRVENDPTLEEMLSTITDDNRQELVDWGKDVGREVIED